MTTTVKERPILFSSPMVLAILEGRKSQTRRIVKPQPGPTADVFQWEDSGEWRANGLICDVKMGPWTCPYGFIGERLWVRETTTYWEDPETCEDYLVYKADGAKRSLSEWAHPHPIYDHCVGRFGKLVVSIHMPRWASRITLEITEVRCQRLQEISEEDAISEGLGIQNGDGSKAGAGYMWQGPGYWDTVSTGEFGRTFHVASPDGVCGCKEGQRLGLTPARCAFRIFWESINGAGSWASSPWVWAISFKRVDGGTQ